MIQIFLKNLSLRIQHSMKKNINYQYYLIGPNILTTEYQIICITKFYGTIWKKSSLYIKMF